MAYDQDLADRVRALLSGEGGVTERRMFGGLAFLLDGNMAVAASGQGGLLVRTDPTDADRLLGRPGTRPMEMRGRPMRGWLYVDTEVVRTRRDLATWVRRGVAAARSHPPKR